MDAGADAIGTPPSLRQSQRTVLEPRWPTAGDEPAIRVPSKVDILLSKFRHVPKTYRKVSRYTCHQFVPYLAQAAVFQKRRSWHKQYSSRSRSSAG
jgi:hypothetical protein